MQQITIEKKNAGLRIDKVLSGLIDGMSRSRVQRLIEDKGVLCNGSVINKKHIVAEDDIITFESTVTRSFEGERTLTPQDIPLTILYEDDAIVAINKPAGLVVHPGHGVADGTLVNALLFRGGTLSGGSSGERPGIVHRLDKDTSGVLLVAKRDSAHFRLAAAFAKRTVKKEYFALCIGKPPAAEGVIELPLDRSLREPIKRMVSPTGKVASTSYRLQLYRNGISVVSFYPHTGRTHQIRVHCSTSGFPILADKLYGGARERILRISPAERPFAYKVIKCFTRQALHAYKITFPHPETDQQLTIKAPLPDEFCDALRFFGEEGIGLL